jgi:transposase-like protein
MTQTSRSDTEERIEAALAAAEACRPTRCPRCGSSEICEMFDADMIQWLCTDCGRPFVERD